MAAEPVLHDGLEATPGQPLQKAAVPILLTGVGPQQSGYQLLQRSTACTARA